MSAPIMDFLRDLQGRPFQYFSNPGNGGDSLIALGAYQTFARLGLSYEFVDERDDPARAAGAVVVVAGGGNLVELYNDCRRFIEPRHARAKRLIILPHTIAGHADLVAQFGPNVDVICRERMSHAFVQAHANGCGVHLMDDMAFSLDVDEVMNGRARLRLPRPKEAARYLRRYWRRTTLPRRTDPKVFNCFRMDRERTAITLPADNVDLPNVLVAGTRPEFCAHAGVRDIFRAFMPAETVNTNRLHMGIAGALMGKAVNFHDNNYGKNRAVYDFSMADRFPNVTWRG